MGDTETQRLGWRPGGAAGYALAVLVTIVASLLRWVLDPVFGETSQYLPYYFSVMLAAVAAGTGPGLLATALGAAIGTWYFVYAGHVGPTWTDDIARLMLFACYGGATTAVAARLHAARDRAAAQARELAAALDALRQSERRYRIVADNTYAWEFWLSPAGRFLYSSPSCARVTGYEAAAFYADPDLLHRIIHPDDRALYAEHRGEDVQGCATEQVEFRIVHRDGGVRWIHHSCGAVHDENGGYLGVRGSNRDITDRKRAEEALRAAHLMAQRARQAAEEANSAKDRFIATLSHELRTPLTAVLPALDILRESVMPDGVEYLEMARRNAEVEARLIDDVLDFSRIGRGKIALDRHPVPICTVLNHAAEVCAADVEARGLHFGIQIDDPPHLVNADAVRLQQVFWNLLKNAVKFTPHGGCVGVRAWREDGRVVVQVADSGEGIDPSDIDRIFQAFEQGDRYVTQRFGGLGLGLAISKALVELHGGTIRAHSEGKGKGSTFTVELPVLAVAHAQTPPALANGAVRAGGVPPSPPKPLRILLVEDHGDTARILGRLLTGEGHMVAHAADVATALQLAAAQPFDLLLSDVGLPDGTGHDLLRELRRLGHAPPAIALSGYGTADDMSNSRAAGFDEHVTKPVNLDALLAALARAATRREAAAQGSL